VAALYAALGAMALGSGCATPALTALVSLYTPAERQGQAMGVFRAFGALGRAFGPICAALAYWFFGSRISYTAGGILMVVPILAGWRLRPVPKED